MTKFTLTRADGGVSIMNLLEGDIATEVARYEASSGHTIVSFEEAASVPVSREFRNAWEAAGGVVNVNMSKAREIHTDHMGAAIGGEIARLKVEERKERLKANTAKADAHAATVIALEALDLNVLATRIDTAPNPTALRAIWPVDVPR